jgi:hypothetical protein
MGEILVELGLIDEHRLRHALEISRRDGIKLGETIIRLAYLGEDQVMGILRNLIDVPILNMKNGVISVEAQKLLPRDRMREMKVVPIAVEKDAVVAAFADPMNYLVVENVKFVINKEVHPVLASQAQVDDILDHLDKFGYGDKKLVLADVRRSISTVTINEKNASYIMRLLDEPGSTDLHLSLGTAPAVRTGGLFKRCNMPIITPSMMYEFVKEILPDEMRETGVQEGGGVHLC